MSARDPHLARRLASGEYVIDCEAVAEAILRRGTTAWFLGSRLTEMLEAGERDDLPGGVEQDDARPRADLP